MPFDPAKFEAEVALKLTPTERLPAAAQDALEAGFDGPHVLRMAILEPAINRKNHLHAAASLDRSRGMDCTWLGKQFVADSCRWLRFEHADLVRFAYLG